MDRRHFLYRSMLAAAAASFPFSNVKRAGRADTGSNEPPGSAPTIIDSNVNLFQWPSRRLKYGTTGSLLQKLRKHRITQAWAGSFEALLHKNIDGVNARLAAECSENGEGMLVPFGTVHPGWPDWEEDLRRCHEEYQMPGIRIYPGYQAFDLDHPDFLPFVRQVAERDLVLQIACDMEDSRVHHPIVHVRDIQVDLLPNIMSQVPEAKVQLLYWNHQVSYDLLKRLMAETPVMLDTTRIESCGGVGRLIEGDPWFGPARTVPIERLLFGSHIPYFPVEANLLKLFESPLTLQQSEAIMAGNARRFLNGA